MEILTFRNTRSEHRSLPPEGGHESPFGDRDGAGEVSLAPHGEEPRHGTGKRFEELGDRQVSQVIPTNYSQLVEGLPECLTFLEHAAVLLRCFPLGGPLQQFLELEKGHVEYVNLKSMVNFSSH